MELTTLKTVFTLFFLCFSRKHTLLILLGRNTECLSVNGLGGDVYLIQGDILGAGAEHLDVGGGGGDADRLPRSLHVRMAGRRYVKFPRTLCSRTLLTLQ